MRHAAQKRPSTGRSLSLRVRALLAGGLVLGLGATATAASWNDSEYATATLTTSTFNTESSVGGAAYADNLTSPGTTVTLPVGGFSPGVKVYVPVLIRTKANSIAGTTVLSGAALTGSGPTAAADVTLFTNNFSYRVVRTVATCNDLAFTSGTPVWVVGSAGAGSVLTAGQPGAATPLAAATSGAPGASTGFCFEVLLSATAPNDLQGKTVSATWHFLSTSN